LKQGRVAKVGKTRQVMEAYQAEGLAHASGESDLRDHPGRVNGSQTVMESVALSTGGQRGVSSVPMGGPLTVEVKFESPAPVRPILGVFVKTMIGLPLFGVNNRFIPGYKFEHAVRSEIGRAHV